ncbi:MAG: polysaccharide biosynthesis protein [Firmicutes bacterium]|nr:polysaccharide biosynthesis protein [Bacillota bacterium]
MLENKFLKGALILTIAGVVVKVIGSVNRIILSRLLGGEGIGLYQMAYPMYQMALSISSAGIPVAISILVAEKLALSDHRAARRIFQISLNVMIVTGIIFSLLLYFGAGWLIETHIVRDARSYYAIVALAPAIFFVTILSSYRGFFQGMQSMAPTAISQIVEQLFRVITMIVLAVVLLPYGLSYAAAGASFGAAPGAAIGVVVLVYYYWKYQKVNQYKITMQDIKSKQESSYSIIKNIVKLALPVSLANIMLPLTANIDLLIVPVRLEVAGYTVEAATELFGYLTGMAVALVNLPTILTASLAASLVPAISEAYTLKNHQAICQRTKTAFRIANLLVIPSFMGIFLLAVPISELLYATPNAGTCISILSFGIILLGIGQVTTGILQGLGHTTIPLINMVIAAMTKLVLSYWLTANPALGIKGAAWATNADFGIAALLNLIFVYRYVGVGINLKDTCKVIVSTLLMGLVVLLSYDFVMVHMLNNTLATLVAIGIGSLVYAILLVVTKSITKRDVESIPKIGRKISNLL